MTKDPAMPVEIEEVVAGLCELHKRLLSCFTSPTGEPPPRRTRFFTPTRADCDAALKAALAIERANIPHLMREIERRDEALRLIVRETHDRKDFVGRRVNGIAYAALSPETQEGRT